MSCPEAIRGQKYGVSMKSVHVVYVCRPLDFVKIIMIILLFSDVFCNTILTNQVGKKFFFGGGGVGKQSVLWAMWKWRMPTIFYSKGNLRNL